VNPEASRIRNTIRSGLVTDLTEDVVHIANLREATPDELLSVATRLLAINASGRPNPHEAFAVAVELLRADFAEALRGAGRQATPAASPRPDQKKHIGRAV
jgi:hypothetical protein